MSMQLTTVGRSRPATVDYIPFLSYEVVINYAAILMTGDMVLGTISAWDGQAWRPIEMLLSVDDRLFWLDEI